ncbi:hypothetical protein M408DRAFT_308391 [Serendipita vermifera MAFF 305830]|uniref:HRDC domain-containing protein n=1 Tax=Serendipita vermifera MAFF 305830 TaxID=933852 RepID=A0A0C3BAH9_SERVB|nr:hypothetical protein M408DRAFT_308391 [Serendipita vermifera MAFF 305830]
MASSIPLPETSLAEYVTLLKTQTDKTVNAAAGLPRDIAFHRTLDRKFKTELDATSARVLRLTNRLLQLAETLDPKSKPAASKVKHGVEDRVALVDEEDVVDKFHSVVVDVFDPLLERVDHCLDVHAGRIKPVQEVKPVLKEDITGASLQKAARLPQHILHASKLPKPQLLFLDKVANSKDTKWQHHPARLWHAKPLTNDTVVSSHPYQHEITTLQYPDFVYTSRPPIAPKSFEDTPFTFVDTKAGLDSLLDKLRQSEEIAIDLEHHSYRSYYGFVCLMQISTRSEDFVVDCLVPEIRAGLEALNEVFTDPTKLKVLHGAESDIVWLQENFNLYIVNLFDTFHASRALELPRASLAFLLSAYCDFTADKRYQLADWRIRPLPSEMLHYARSDTHFLLFVYDQLREALLEKSKSSNSESSGGTSSIPSFVRTVLKNSETTSLREFVREQYDAENGEGMRGWAGLVRKWNKRSLLVDGLQRRLFLAVHKWRDEVAREEDESSLFVIPNQPLLTLIEKPVPTDLIALYSSFPGAVPPLIRKRGNELLKLMQDVASKSMAIEGPMSSTKPEVDTLMEVEDVSVVIDTPRHIIFAPQATPVPGLWGAPKLASQPVNTNFSTSRSSLFGNLSKVTKSIFLSQNDNAPPATVAKLSAPHSSFLGTGSRSAVPSSSTISQKIAKIHDGILKADKQVISIRTSSKPTTASPDVPASKPSVKEESANVEVEPTPVVPMEVAFVPRSQRHTTQPDDLDIVQVGQRKKKRKRVDEGEQGAAQRKKRGSTSTAPGPDGDEEKETTPELKVFDYSAEPNILDEGMKGVETGGARKGKHIKKDVNKGVWLLGFHFVLVLIVYPGTRLDFKSLGFGPAPKAMNEPKSGNKSMTFR